MNDEDDANAVGCMGLVVEYTDGRCLSVHGPIAYHKRFEGFLPGLEKEFPANDLDRNAAGLLHSWHRLNAGDTKMKAMVMMLGHLLLKRSRGSKGFSVYGKLTREGEAIKGSITRHYAPNDRSLEQAQGNIIGVLTTLKNNVEGA